MKDVPSRSMWWTLTLHQCAPVNKYLGWGCDNAKSKLIACAMAEIAQSKVGFVCHVNLNHMVIRHKFHQIGPVLPSRWT